MPYQALIFDLGKVVFDVSFDLCFAYWAKASGQSFDTIKSRFHFDQDFEDFEKNAISADNFRKRISDKLGLT